MFIHNYMCICRFCRIPVGAKSVIFDDGILTDHHTKVKIFPGRKVLHVITVVPSDG